MLSYTIFFCAKQFFLSISTHKTYSESVSIFLIYFECSFLKYIKIPPDFLMKCFLGFSNEQKPGKVIMSVSPILDSEKKRRSYSFNISEKSGYCPRFFKPQTFKLASRNVRSFKLILHSASLNLVSVFEHKVSAPLTS